MSNPPRWLLGAQASTLRGSINLVQNYFSSPIYSYYSHVPFLPTFTLDIPSQSSATSGTIKLIFYTPPSYTSELKPNPRSEGQEPPTTPLPCIVNFHGGGFVIGTGIDDERWARCCVEHLGAIFCSVEYRLAPQYVFPTAHQDGVDALLYLHSHAKELGIDVENIVTSGFSSGGNLAFTVPMLLSDVLAARRKKKLEEGGGDEDVADFGVKAVVSWYPGTDSTRSREVRAASMAAPQKKLPTWLTTIFDASYRYPPDLDLAHPYLSPGLASDALLRKALPRDIVLYTCEHDMLCEEGKIFAERLGNEVLGKEVRYRCVKDVPHAWDKGPNPMPKPEPVYEEVCGILKEIFGLNPSTNPVNEGLNKSQDINDGRT